IQVASEVAFSSGSVRLDAASAPNGEESSMSFWDGAFGALVGAIIGGVLAYRGSKVGADMQVKALKAQSEEERRRFQQTKHQKKYAMALGLRLEAQRLHAAAEKRISVAQG